MNLPESTADVALTTHPALLPDHGGLLRGAVGLTLITLLGFGLLYSLAGVGLGQALFPVQASGSLLSHDGRTVGSVWVAQPFAGAGYFQPRPSAANYLPMAMAGSNQARTNPDLRRRLAATQAAVAEREGIAPEAVPDDLITQSGSGVDPHISPAAAAVQIERVARERGLAVKVVQALVAQHTKGKQLGMLGDARVNVLALNLALHALQPEAGQRTP